MLGKSSKKKEKLKVLLLTQFFFPDRTGTGKILGELFTGLSTKNFTTSVISSRQEYGSSGNKLLPSEEKYGGVTVKRVGSYYFSKDKALGRILNYILVFIYTLWAAYRYSLTKNKDIIVCVSNPPIMPLLSVFLRKNKQKTVYILHDLYPDIAIAMGVIGEKHIFSKIVYVCNKYVFKKLDKIVVLGEDMKCYLIHKYAIPKEKLMVIPNWASTDYYSLNENDNDKFEVLYSGNMGRFHQLDIAVRALAGKKNINLHFIGEGQAKQSLINQSIDVDNVQFDTFLDDSNYRKALQNADVLFVSLEHNLSGLAVPSKFYTYLSAGKPIICVADESTQIAKLIKQYKCGFVITHNDADAFFQCVEKLAREDDLRKRMGSNAHMLYKKYFCRENIIKQYEKLFEEIGE